jgi:hypothetical protein
MKTLFEMPAGDPVDEKRGKKRKPEPTVEPEAVPEFRVSVPLAAMILGTIDEGVVCIGQTCQATAHDIVEESGGRWLVECAFCGTGQWIKAVKGHLKPQNGVFVFNTGDYAGQTLDAVGSTPRGMGYIEWSAENHKIDAVRVASKTWLASNANAR